MLLLSNSAAADPLPSGQRCWKIQSWPQRAGPSGLKGHLIVTYPLPSPKVVPLFFSCPSLLKILTLDPKWGATNVCAQGVLDSRGEGRWGKDKFQCHSPQMTLNILIRVFQLNRDTNNVLNTQLIVKVCAGMETGAVCMCEWRQWY